MPKKIRVEYIGLQLIITVLVIAASVYLNSFRNGFIWDDHTLIENNVFITNWKYLPKIFHTHVYYFGSRASNYYRPLQSFSYMIDYAFWHLNPLGYHLTNLIFHLLNILLVFVLTNIIANNSKVSAITALLFGIHPVHSETVTYISARSDLLYVFFLLMSLILYIKHRRQLEGGGLKHKYYLLSLVCYSFSLLAKEAALILPFLLFLFDFSFKDKRDLIWSWKERIKSYVLFFMVSFAYLAIRIIVLPATPVVTAPNLFIRFITALKAILGYVKLIIMPLNLHMERFIALEISFREFFALIVFLFTAVFLIAKSYKHSKIIFFSACWFLITLLPFSNVVVPLTAAMAEHWLYLASIGFFAIVAYAVVKVFSLKKGKVFYWKGLKLSVIILTVSAIVFFCVLTVMRNAEWGDEMKFFQKILKNNPGFDIDRVHDNLARIYYKRGLLRQAEIETKRALAINPNYPEALCLLGVLYGENGNYNDAITQLKKAIEINPLYVEAYRNLGVTYAKLGNFKNAIDLWNRALEINPYNEAIRIDIEKATRLLIK